MPIRPFMDTLREVEFGCLLEDLSEEQHKLIQAVQDTGRAAELKLTLKYNPSGNGQLMVTAKIDAKTPTMPRGQTPFFTTPEGNIQTKHPKQTAFEGMDLREVPRDRNQSNEAQ